MLPLRIVPYYAAVLAVLYVGLAFRVIAARRAGKVALGTAGNPAVMRAARVHGNFAEYVPYGLLLTAMVEVRGAPGWVLHALCLALLIGRVSHAYGVSQANEVFRFRVTGMALTFGVFIASAIAIVLT